MEKVYVYWKKTKDSAEEDTYVVKEFKDGESSGFVDIAVPTEEEATNLYIAITKTLAFCGFHIAIEEKNQGGGWSRVMEK